ncbi:sugar transferase [Leptolyngbya sp. AN02str]|uniref:sugar transferase n=1 Tax=Leptolyngbya sp. AN02str TaxID=3423363 RepID=UPI003D31A724
MSGEWQVNGRSSVEDFEQIVALDLAYQEKWSTQYDFWSILKTPAIVLRRSGAY